LSDGQSIGNAAALRTGSPVRAAIAQAAQATGVDFDYLLAQARLESSLDPSARADTSSAAGLYQFTSGTWVDTLGRHAAEHGMGWVSDAIASGGLSDPSTRAQVMGLRYDPQVSALMAAELASDNRDGLTTQLGRAPDASELYLAHFLGAAGAGQFLSALSENPDQSAAVVLPKAAAANRAIFFAGAAPRSVGAVMDLLRARVSGAMEGGVDRAGDVRLAYEPVAQQGYLPPPPGPIAQEFHAVSREMPAGPVRSMAETLQSAFGASSGAAPAHVRDAYAKLARFGL